MDIRWLVGFGRFGAVLAMMSLGPLARGAEGPPSMSVPAPGHPTTRPASGGADVAGAPVGGWTGMTVVALVLVATGAGVAVFRVRGGASWTGAAGMQVVGRTALGPRHAAYLVRVGERVLVVGTGAGGAPSLLAEMDADVLKPTPVAASGGGR